VRFSRVLIGIQARTAVPRFTTPWYFDYPRHADVGDGEIIVLVRRDGRCRRKIRKLDSDRRVGLHPAAVLAPLPGTSDTFAAAFPRFYGTPAILTREGLELAKLCRAEQRVGRVLAIMRNKGFAPADVAAPLTAMGEYNLCLVR